MTAILVTGDSSGIGLAAVHRLLECTNWQVVGIARHVPPDISALSHAYPGRFTHIPFDLSNLEGIEQELPRHLAVASDSYVGFLDNAGIVTHSLATGLARTDLERIMRINFLAPALLSRIMIRHFVSKKIPGSIVHVSSVAAQIGFRGLTAYSAAKGALEAFSRALAVEWGSRGIRSNVLSLGLLDIGISRSLSPDYVAGVRARSPLGRLTDLSTVLDAITYLLSSHSASITAQTIGINAGLH